MLACCEFDPPHLVGTHVCNQQVALGAWQEHHVHGSVEPGTQGCGNCVAGLDGRGQAGHAGNRDDVRAAAVGDKLSDKAVASISCTRRPSSEGGKVQRWHRLRIRKLSAAAGEQPQHGILLRAPSSSACCISPIKRLLSLSTARPLGVVRVTNSAGRSPLYPTGTCKGGVTGKGQAMHRKEQAKEDERATEVQL